MPTMTTRLSTKGQVVIPASARRRLRLNPGDQLSIELGSVRDRTLILRGPGPDDLEQRLAKGAEWLRRQRISLVESLHRDRERERISEKNRRRP